MADQFLVGVAVEDHVHRLAELLAQGLGGLAFGEDEAGAVGGGGYPGAGPLDVVDHSYGYASGLDDAGGVGETVAFLHRVFVAADGEYRGDGLEVVENAKAF